MINRLNYQETVMNRNNIIILVVLVGLAYATGRYLQPAEIETRTETIVKEVEVIKKDVEIIKKKRTNTDGSIEEEEITRDRSTESTSRDKENRTESIVSNQKSQWKMYAQAGYDFNNKDNVYGLGVEKRYLGPISLGVWGNNKQTAGLSVSVEF